MAEQLLYFIHVRLHDVQHNNSVPIIIHIYDYNTNNKVSRNTTYSENKNFNFSLCCKLLYHVVCICSIGSVNSYEVVLKKMSRTPKTKQNISFRH